MFDSPEERGTRLPWLSTSPGRTVLHGQRRVQVKA
jgi:hypothetical protein